MQVDPKSPVPIYAQVVEALKQAVAQGRYRAGEALPSVRALAAELRINPNTVMRAYQLLELTGFTATRRGKGIFVADNAPALCRRELGRADLTRLEKLVAQLRGQGVGAAAIQAAVKRALAEHSRQEDEHDHTAAG